MSRSIRGSAPAVAGGPELGDLLRAAQAGERDAFTRIYECFVRAVHGIALGACGPDDADDVVQEVFLVIQKKIDSVADPDALPGWICAIARNLAVDQVRRQRRAPHLAALPELPAPADRRDDTLSVHLLARVRELPEAYRETLVLRLVEGLGGEAIAAATGRSHGAVRVNLHRGMTLLREALRKDGWP